MRPGPGPEGRGLRSGTVEPFAGLDEKRFG
jgi:hypothetical protein